MKSFKSFDELLQEEPRIENILVNYEKYYAHTHKKRDFEKLHKHVHLVMEYAKKLINTHGLDMLINSMIYELIKAYGKVEHIETVGNFIKSLFVNTLVYHDYGKVNENFQIDKMQDKNFFKVNENNKIGSQHSILSAYVFLNVHLNRILEDKVISKYERNLLAVSIFLFANPILKHHSSFFEHKPYFEEEKITALEQYLIKFKTKLTTDTKKYFLLTEKIFEKFPKIFSSESRDFIPYYAILKLNYSLLTASDYYATGEYMQCLKVNDFGLIEGDLRKKIIKNFKTIKVYNNELFDKTKELKKLPFSDLQQQSKVNLNRLRQKLAAEVLSNLRNSPNDNLFYLEAPTGAGKTNIALVIAIELLEKNPKLNKIFYVFPFTTLVTQTFGAIKETLGIDNEHIIQLHSKSGFHQQNEEENDGNYGDNRMNFINNHFVNYPITLLTHIKFFDILKGNSKETNYIFHRLANSIVIIDELQSYNPNHWDKVIFFLSNYAQLFNIKIILMSATLPKIDNLLDQKSEMRGKVKYLLSKENKSQFFQNPNFAGRVKFDFSILDKYNWKQPQNEQDKESYLCFLKDKLFTESEDYAQNNPQKANSVRTLIEFITKKTAFKFFKSLQEDPRFENYELYLISGEILDPRRREIIEAIKENKDEKVILVTTQVVEAGVDIDMDLGFKDRSLIDSDEQLAGRVNRNASKQNCKVYMFDFDKTRFIYKNDKRLDVAAVYQNDTYKSILNSKDFDTNFYDNVKNEIIKLNESSLIQNLSDYLAYFKRFNFHEINNKFKLIEQDNGSVFVPLPIPKKHFDNTDLVVLEYFEIPDFENEEGITCINGKDVWDRYIEIIGFSKERKGDYMHNQTKLKQIYGVLSKFMFSSFNNQIEKIKLYLDNGDGFTDYKQFGLYYLSSWEEIYSYDGGLNMNYIDSDIFL